MAVLPIHEYLHQFPRYRYILPNASHAQLRPPDLIVAAKCPADVKDGGLVCLKPVS